MSCAARSDRRNLKNRRAFPVVSNLEQDGPGLGDPEDGVDEQAVVPGPLPRRAGPFGQQALDAVEVLVPDGVAALPGSLGYTTDHASIIHTSFSIVHTT